jgi:hypothetical protein
MGGVGKFRLPAELTRSPFPPATPLCWLRVIQENADLPGGRELTAQIVTSLSSVQGSRHSLGTGQLPRKIETHIFEQRVAENLRYSTAQRVKTLVRY